MNKGQLLPLIIGMLLLLIVWRMPDGELAKCVEEIIADLRAGWLLGYALFVLAIGGWAAHAKRARDLNHRLLEQMPAALAEQKRAIPEKDSGAVPQQKEKAK